MPMATAAASCYSARSPTRAASTESIAQAPTSCSRSSKASARRQFFSPPHCEVTSLRCTIPRFFPDRGQRMRKLPLLGIGLFTVSLAFAQHDSDYSKVQIKVTKVAGTVYMLEGAGGNIAASVGEDGIV